MYAVSQSRDDVLSGHSPRGTVVLSKRELGEAYFFCIAVTFGAVLGAMLLFQTPATSAWTVLGLIPLGVLLAFTHWLRSLEFDRRQIWRISQWGGLGTGTATICLVVGQLFVDSPVVSQPLTVSLLTIITMSTIGGALVGVAVESQRSKRQMEIRHSVLDRVLRHNLRNDMNVVLANLKTAKSRVDGPERGQLTTVERKIEQLLDLVDNIRRVDTSFGTRSCVPVRIELVSLLETRVADLRQSHPDLELSTDFPDQAWVYAEEQFPLVIDNFVQSAIMYSTEAPSLHVEVTVAEEVVLRLDDVGHTIPDPDLSALTTGQEGRLTHGRGVELWLATWLTERSDGEMTIDAEGDSRSITVTLTRASEG